MIARFWITFWAVFYRQSVRLMRHKAFFVSLVVLQVAEILTMGWIDILVRDMPIVIVDQDHSAESREVIQRVDATHVFAVRYATSSTEQARSHIRGGRAKAALIIPPDFGRRRAAGQDAQLMLLVDGSDSRLSSQATAAIEGLAFHMGVQSSQETVASVEPHASILFNPSGRATLFMLPGLLAIILSSRFMNGCLTIPQDREAGSLDRLLMTPMSNAGLVLGCVGPYIFLAIANAVVYTLIMRFGFGVPFRGNAPFLFVTIVLYTFSFLSLGLLVAAPARTENDALTIILLIQLPRTLLSGYIFPLSSIPKALLPVSYAMPETHFIQIMRGVCLRGSTPAELAPHVLFLLICTPVFLTLATWRFSRSINR